jgi:hypothetical protein
MNYLKQFAENLTKNMNPEYQLIPDQDHDNKPISRMCTLEHGRPFREKQERIAEEKRKKIQERIAEESRMEELSRRMEYNQQNGISCSAFRLERLKQKNSGIVKIIV